MTSCGASLRYCVTKLEAHRISNHSPATAGFFGRIATMKIDPRQLSFQFGRPPVVVPAKPAAEQTSLGSVLARKKGITSTFS
jgi:hypothetical protein